MKLEQRAQAIELVLADVDGVLTDGGIIFDNQGIETKQFHIRDGMGIRLWQRAGYRFGMITGRSSHIVKLRAAELGVEIVRQTAEDKLPVVAEIAAQLRLNLSQVCYIGDDLPDLPVIRAAGLGVAVADACAEVRQAAHHVTTARGGEGAVRETIETILKAQKRWEDLVQKYSS
jgi:YrbI family 3-deoxy-D-manno-octulosonate 8-phosphate phosphatase